MSRKSQLPGSLIAGLRRLALRFPETDEGISCDKAAFKAHGKAFLFVGCGEATDCVMLKLGESLPEAARLAAKNPATFKVGGTGWVTITIAKGNTLPPDLLPRWINESFRLLAPKTLVAQLPAAETKPTLRKKMALQTKTRKKRAST